MSQAFTIACHDCQVRLWIGQRGTNQSILYGTEACRQQQRDFFYGHIGHRLEFNASDALTLVDYPDLAFADEEDEEGTP